MDTNARPEVIKTGSGTNSMTIHGVRMNVQYCIQLLGFTVKGDGPLSPCAVIRTWTDGKRSYDKAMKYTEEIKRN